MNRAILLALGTLIALGSADFLRKVILSRGVDTLGYFVLESGFVFLWGSLSALLLRRIPRFEPQLVGFASLSGLLIAAGIIAFLLALGLGEASRTAPIGRLGMVLTVALAIFILDEPLTPTKLLGLVFGIFAVLLLSR